MSRKTDRRHAFNLIFQADFRKDMTTGELFNEYFENSMFSDESLMLAENADKEYVMKTLEGVMERTADIDREIAEFARGWELNRLIKADLAILRLAVYEILYSKNVPAKVAINEAVELSKVYSGDDSPAFVNGLLGQLAKARGI